MGKKFNSVNVEDEIDHSDAPIVKFNIQEDQNRYKNAAPPGKDPSNAANSQIVESTDSKKNNNIRIQKIAQLQLRSKKLKPEAQDKAEKSITFDKGRENQIKDPQIAIDQNQKVIERVGSLGDIIQISDTYQFSQSKNQGDKNRLGLESTVAYDDSHAIESTVVYVNDPKFRTKQAATKVQNLIKLGGASQGQFKTVKGKEMDRDLLVDTLEDTVKYPEDDQGSDTDQINGQAQGEGSLDPTVYYGSTDEEYDTDSQVYLDDTEEYVPTQQSTLAKNKTHPNNLGKNTVQESSHIIDHLSQVYLNALQMLHHDEYDAAFRQVMDMQDDFYLMKLMTKTGACWHQLQDSTARLLKKRIEEVFKSGFLDSLKTQWLGPDFREEQYAVDYYEDDQLQYPDNIEQLSLNQDAPTESEIQSLIGRYNIRANS